MRWMQMGISLPQIGHQKIGDDNPKQKQKDNKARAIRIVQTLRPFGLRAAVNGAD